jgi:predicted  nucleic acid-binding Zn-ribbon protein
LRADTAESAAQGLSALPAVAAAAAVGSGASPEALALTRQQLEAHAIEAREVGTAADGVDDLNRRLAELRGQASRHHLRIDGDSDTVTDEPTSTGDGESSQATITALQEKLEAIIADANRIDHELARALGIAEETQACRESPTAEAS